MPTKITAFEAFDIRFPTSQHLDGSDAMNPDPDYSAAYVVLRTDAADRCGYGMTFTIGRGNEICVAAIHSLATLLIGQTVESLMAEPVTLYRKLTGDSQLRWVGPVKGVIHLAAAAVINAVWDLWARILNKPVWQVICDMSPAQFVASVDFRYLTAALTPHQALELLERHAATRAVRIDELQGVSLLEGIPEDQWCSEPNEDGNYAQGMKPADDFLERIGYRLPMLTGPTQLMTKEKFLSILAIRVR